MKKIRIMNITKKMTAGVFAAVMVLTGSSILSIKADAAVYGADGYEDTIIYTNTEYNIQDYWAEKKAPAKEGYVFGGWYEDEGNTPLTEETAKAAKTAYAKFVPAYVLSVKAQLNSGVAATDGKDASIRLVSSVDSNQYAKVGFKVLLANQVDVAEVKDTDLETTAVYKYLQVGTETYEAEKVFGTKSALFSVWRLDGFKDGWDSMIVNVTPYWVTLDGTKVEGVAKYVHVEDGLNGYISVPIHVQSSEALAAGTLLMTYPASDLELVDVEYCDTDGELRKAVELDYYDDTEGSIRIAANAKTVHTSFATDGIYANVRFSVKSESTYKGVGKGSFLDFQVSEEKFANWSEVVVADATAWNMQY